MLPLEAIELDAFRRRTSSSCPPLEERTIGWCMNAHRDARDAGTRLRNWAINGTWERVFTALLAQADAGDARRP
ncbi:hypothetical protein [Streptomyces mirabilis]|uniref:hypothetical protein n=1 Tax=Streptomyces mirabilis TaxID=68239 RepID=UPI0036AAB73F